MEEHPKNRNRYFIHDSELNEMESEDKQKLIEELCKTKNLTDYNLKRLDIAKEVLIALLGNNFVMSRELYKCDIVDSAIRMADRLLEKIKE